MINSRRGNFEIVGVVPGRGFAGTGKGELVWYIEISHRFSACEPLPIGWMVIMEPLDEDDEATESMCEPLEAAGADIISTGDQQVLDRQASKDLSLGSNGLWKSSGFIADVGGPTAMEASSGTDTDEEGIMIKQQQQLRINQTMVGAGDGGYNI